MCNGSMYGLDTHLAIMCDMLRLYKLHAAPEIKILSLIRDSHLYRLRRLQSSTNLMFCTHPCMHDPEVLMYLSTCF